MFCFQAGKNIVSFIVQNSCGKDFVSSFILREESAEMFLNYVFLILSFDSLLSHYSVVSPLNLSRLRVNEDEKTA